MTHSPLFPSIHEERCVYDSTTKTQRDRSQWQTEVTPCVPIWDTNLKVMGPEVSKILRRALLCVIYLRNQGLPPYTYRDFGYGIFFCSRG